MAKSLKNDVELVISARNEASKSIDQVIESVEQLAKESEQGSKGLFGGLLRDSEQMRAEQEKIQTALRDVIAAEKELEKVGRDAAKALDTQRAAIDKSQQGLAKLNDRYDELQRAATQARKPSEGLVTQFERQQQKQTELAESIRQMREELDRVGQNVQVGNVDERATAAIEKQRQKVKELGQTWRDTTQQIAAAQQKLDSSADAKTGADEIQRIEQEKLDTLRQQREEAKKLKAELGKQARAEKKSATEKKTAYREATEQYNRLREAVNQQILVEREARKVRDEATKSYNAEQKAVDKLVATADKQKAAYTEVRNELEKFEQAQRDASTERQQKEYEALAAKLERLENQYQQTGEKLKRTQAQIDKASGPDPQAVARFEKLQAQIAETEAEIREETVAFEKLQKQMKEAGNDTKSLAADKERLANASRTLENRQEQLNNELGETTAATKQAGREATRAGKQFRFWGDDSRQALSYLQRIRGELLAIGTAYVGVYAAGDAIRSVYDASVLATKSTARLKTRFGDDTDSIERELEYISQLSDQVAVEREILQDEYTKFAAGIPEDIASMNDVRVIFEGFASAARASGASMDDLQGTFVAVTQMVSKGQVTMEELRQQLGDRLPGAVPILAEALGVTVDEMDKMIERGEIAGEAVILLADRMKERYGDSLETQLEGPQAAFAKLRNRLLEIREIMADSGFIDTLIQGMREVVETMRQPEFEEAAQNLAKGLAAAAKIAVSAVKNFESILAVIKAIMVLQLSKWAYNNGKAFLEMTASIATSARQMKTATTGAARLRGALAALGKLVLMLPAIFYAGFQIGKILYDQFPAVRKFGLLLVHTFEVAKIEVDRLWKEGQLFFEGGWKDVIKDVGKFIITVIPNAISYVNKGIVGLMSLVSDEWARTYDQLNKQYEANVDATANRILGIDTDAPDNFANQIAELREEADGEIAKVEETIQGLWNGIEDGPDTGQAEKSISDLRADFEKAVGDADPFKGGEDDGGEYGKDFTEGLIEQFKGIEDELAEASADTLDERLALIERKYREFLTDLDKLAAQGALPPALQGARDQVETLIALRKEQEKQKFIAEQTQEVEQKINDLQTERDDQIERINEKHELGMISGEERANQAATANEAYIDRMRSVIREARALARENSNTELSSLLSGYDNFEEMEQRRTELARVEELERRINEAFDDRKDQIQVVNDLRELGGIKTAEAEQRVAQILEQSNESISSMVDEAIALARELGKPELVERLELMKLRLTEQKDQWVDLGQLVSSFGSGFADAWGQFIQGTKSATEAFRQFASDFLAQISQMIVQAMVLKALTGSTTGEAGAGGYGGILGKIFHEGGVVGSGGSSRTVNPLWFTNALRYHSGGIAGLKPDEVPAVLEQGEEVLTRDDPRHRANGGSTNSSPMSIKVVNAIDSSSVVAEGLNNGEGQKAILNFMRANKKQIKSVLN